MSYTKNSVIAKNRVVDFKGAQNGSTAIRMLGSPENTIVSNYIAGIKGVSFGIDSRDCERNFISDNEITGFISYGLRCIACCSNSVVCRNLIYCDFGGYVPIGIMIAEKGKGSGTIVHNNRIIHGVGIWQQFFSVNSATNMVFSYNTMLSQGYEWTPYRLFQMCFSPTSPPLTGKVFYNTFVHRITNGSAIYVDDPGSTNGYLEFNFESNVIFSAAGSNIVENRSSSNRFCGNFYATNDYRGLSAPVELFPVSVVDERAISGICGYAPVYSNTAVNVVGHSIDTNKNGGRTCVIYNTKRGNTLNLDTTGLPLIHIYTNWWSDKRVGLGAREMAAPVSLFVLNSFRQGSCFMTVKWAFDRESILGLDRRTLKFYRWNVDDLTNHYWQLAVSGNFTNSYFPENNTNFVLGESTTNLGNYGVNLSDNTVWMNLNYDGIFCVFGEPLNAGTIITIH
jgi:hypothetical protein